MANITEIENFAKQPLYIPNRIDISAQNSGATTPNQKADLQHLINVYEKEVLLAAFGAKTYTQLQAVLSNLDGAGNEKWKKLVEGDENYIVNDKSYSWQGLKSSTLNNSLITHYIYCKFLIHNEEQLTTTGVKKVKSAGSTDASASPKFVESWQSFMTKYQNGIDNQPILLTTFEGQVAGVDFYHQNDNNSRSLYQYLCDKEDDFPDVQFTMISLGESYNSFGI